MCCIKAKSAFVRGTSLSYSKNRSSLSNILLADQFAENGRLTMITWNKIPLYQGCAQCRIKKRGRPQPAPMGRFLPYRGNEPSRYFCQEVILRIGAGQKNVKTRLEIFTLLPIRHLKCQWMTVSFINLAIAIDKRNPQINNRAKFFFGVP